MGHADLELYIQVKDGQPFEHPIFADNFKLVFPDVDVNNLPADRFAKFIRVAQPEIGVYEVCEGPSYEWFGDVVKDVYSVRPMTDEERAQKDVELAAEEAIKKEMQVRGLHNYRTEKCRNHANEATDPVEKQLWADCLTAHEAWGFENSDPITPPFPLFPIQDENGNWVPRT